MANTVLPLSSDIYLEVDGKKVAVVQSYTTRATRTSREIEAFGENEPVATIAGANKYTLELSRLYATDEAISDGINFYDLNDFSLVICKPDTAARKARKIRLGGGFSQFFIVNGANCPIKTKNPRIPAWFRFGRSALADDLLRRAEDHVIDVEAFEVFKHHIGSHAPFSF